MLKNTFKKKSGFIETIIRIRFDFPSFDDKVFNVGKTALNDKAVNFFEGRSEINGE